MNIRNKRREVFAGIKKNVFFLSLVSLFTDVSSEMIYPLLPVFLSSVLGVGTVFIGLIEGIAESSASILKVFSGWFSDKIRRRKVLVFIGYSLSTVSKPLFALAAAGWHVLAVRFGDRVGKGIRTSPRDAIIADSTPVETRGRAYGFHRSMDTLGEVVGPLCAFALLPLLGLTLGQKLRWLFLCSFIPAILAVAILAFFVRERIQQPKSKSSSSNIRPGWSQFSSNFKWFILITAIFTLGNSSDAFLIVRADKSGISLRFIPLLWLAKSIIYTVTAFPAGILSDKLGRKKIITIGFLIYSLVYFGFAFASKSIHIWVLFAIYGLFYGLTDGVFRAAVADMVPENLRATSFGIYHTTVGLAVFPASLIMGFLWKVAGVQIAFGFGAGLALLAAILTILFFEIKVRNRDYI